MSLEGEKLAARFSHNCWKIRMRGHCDLLKDFARKGAKRDESVHVLKALDSFAYYKIIASQNNISDPFDLRVVKAYWFGDDDLVRKIENNDQVFLPFHNYTIILDHIHHSALEEIDRCKVSVAKVWEVKESCINVRHTAINQKENKIIFVEPRLDSINRGFVDDIIKREWIAYHEGEAIQKIEKEEAIKLVNRTKDAIKLFNEQTASKSRE